MDGHRFDNGKEALSFCCKKLTLGVSLGLFPQYERIMQLLLRQCWMHIRCVYASIPRSLPILDLMVFHDQHYKVVDTNDREYFGLWYLWYSSITENQSFTFGEGTGSTKSFEWIHADLILLTDQLKSSISQFCCNLPVNDGASFSPRDHPEYERLSNAYLEDSNNGGGRLGRALKSTGLAGSVITGTCCADSYHNAS
jgi:hypothetical protein